MNRQASLPLLLICLPLLGATPSAAQSDALHGLKSADMQSLESAYRSAQLTAMPVVGGYQMRNPSKGLVGHFGGRDFTVTPLKGDWSWGLALEGYGFEGSVQSVHDALTTHVEGNRITYQWDAHLDEWYLNDHRGLEHGYTLRKRPENPAGVAELTFSLDVLGDLIPEVSENGRDVIFMGAAGEPVVTYAGLTVFDAVGLTMPAFFERHGDDLLLTIDERQATYPLTIDPVVQTAYLKASNAGAHDNFGWGVAMSEDTVLISAVGEDSGATGVNGDGADNSVANSGAVYVFVRNGSSWIQQAYLKSSNPDVFDYFGKAMAISGDTIVIGAPDEASAATTVNGAQLDNSAKDAGAAYVFVRSGGVWTQEAYLKAPNAEAGDQFGSSVAISGDRIIIGAPGESSGASGINGDSSDNSMHRSGSAYLFTRFQNNWSSQLYLKASNPDSMDGFGRQVAIQGDAIMVSAPNESSSSGGIDGDQSDNSMSSAGAVYSYRLTGEVWTEENYIKSPSPDSADMFGNSISLSGRTCVVGAPWEDSSSVGPGGDSADNSKSSSGAAFVFDRGAQGWYQSAFLKASNAEQSDAFGKAVGISGDRIVVSAINERSSAIGVDGDQGNNSMVGAGAAYVFQRSAGLWTQEAYLKSSNTSKQDFFSTSVAINGNTVVACSHWEDSDATGVQGDQGNDLADSAGAGYVFELEAVCGVSSYGPGTGANVAKLWSYNAPIEGDKFDFELTELPSTGLAFLMISAAPLNAPFLGGTLLVNPSLALLGPNEVIMLLAPGSKTSLQTQVLPGMAGYTFYAQAGMLDPGMPAGVALTNGLKVQVCP